jgi:hypothetical protein
VRFIPNWQDPSAAENWFYHHAVLIVRGLVVPPPANPLEDPLVIHGPAANPMYVAFVRALRHLPPQQREAFVLHHGERLNPRMLGVAMDCSTDAAATHLRAATDALNGVTEGRAERLAAELTRAYADMHAAEPAPTEQVRVHVGRARRGMRLRRAIALLVVLAGVAAIAWAAWTFRDDLLRMISGST